MHKERKEAGYYLPEEEMRGHLQETGQKCKGGPTTGRE